MNDCAKQVNFFWYELLEYPQSMQTSSLKNAELSPRVKYNVFEVTGSLSGCEMVLSETNMELYNECCSPFYYK
jgi:hypothetical protein